MALTPDGKFVGIAYPPPAAPKRVKIETPCAGHPPQWLEALSPALASIAELIERKFWHGHYTALCLRDSLLRGEAPYSSQALYDHASVLDDADPADRKRGMLAGLAWSASAELCAVYCDHGISKGMREGMRFACERGIRLERRYLYAPDGTRAPMGHTLDELEEI